MMNKKNLKLAYQDIISSFLLWRVWLSLAWQDIKLRYRRSQLGPVWITISTAIMVYTIGFLYGNLFKINLSSYYPYLASGIISWTFISTTITESNDAFMDSQQYINQINLPFTIYILRVLTRNLIIFLHNLVPIIPILIFFHIHFGLTHFIFVLFAILIVWLCGISYGTLFALLGTRFRDIKPILSSILYVTFLITPIMWMPNHLPDKYQYLITFNPFNQLITLLRAPMIGDIPSWTIIGHCLIILMIGFVIHILLFWRTRHRISFWT